MSKIIQCRIATSNGRSHDCGVTHDLRANGEYGASFPLPSAGFIIPPLLANETTVGSDIDSYINYFLFDVAKIPPGSYIKNAEVILTYADPASAIGAQKILDVGIIDPVYSVANAAYRPVVAAPNINNVLAIDPPPRNISRGTTGKLGVHLRETTNVLATPGFAVSQANLNIPLRRAYTDSKTGQTIPYVSNIGQLLIGSPSVSPTLCDNASIRMSKTGVLAVGDLVLQVFASNSNGEALSLLAQTNTAWSSFPLPVSTQTIAFSPSFNIFTGEYYLVVFSSTAPYSNNLYGNIRMRNSTEIDSAEDFLVDGRVDGFSYANYAVRADLPQPRSVLFENTYIAPYQNKIIRTTSVESALQSKIDVTSLVRDFIRSPVYRGFSERLIGIVFQGIVTLEDLSDRYNDYVLQIDYVPPQVFIT